MFEFQEILQPQSILHLATQIHVQPASNRINIFSYRYITPQAGSFCTSACTHVFLEVFESVASGSDEEADKVDVGVLLLGNHHLVTHTHNRRPAEHQHHHINNNTSVRSRYDITKKCNKCVPLYNLK